jgi:hypothetical protein
MLSLAVPWDKRKGRCRHNITTKLADGNRQEDDVQCSAGNKLHLIPQWTEEHGKETKTQSSTSKESDQKGRGASKLDYATDSQSPGGVFQCLFENVCSLAVPFVSDLQLLIVWFTYLIGHMCSVVESAVQVATASADALVSSRFWFLSSECPFAKL